MKKRLFLTALILMAFLLVGCSDPDNSFIQMGKEAGEILQPYTEGE